jgi:hypothetical protein
LRRVGRNPPAPQVAPTARVPHPSRPCEGRDVNLPTAIAPQPLAPPHCLFRPNFNHPWNARGVILKPAPQVRSQKATNNGIALFPGSVSDRAAWRREQPTSHPSQPREGWGTRSPGTGESKGGRPAFSVLSPPHKIVILSKGASAPQSKDLRAAIRDSMSDGCRPPPPERPMPDLFISPKWNLRLQFAASFVCHSQSESASRVCRFSCLSFPQGICVCRVPHPSPPKGWDAT